MVEVVRRGSRADEGCGMVGEIVSSWLVFGDGIELSGKKVSE